MIYIIICALHISLGTKNHENNHENGDFQHGEGEGEGERMRARE